ncbi:hypothetical protein PSPO01_01167 [Paraphaeosphaeria sporulosa]
MPMLMPRINTRHTCTPSYQAARCHFSEAWNASTNAEDDGKSEKRTAFSRLPILTAHGDATGRGGKQGMGEFEFAVPWGRCLAALPRAKCRRRGGRQGCRGLGTTSLLDVVVWWLSCSCLLLNQRVAGYMAEAVRSGERALRSLALPLQIQRCGTAWELVWWWWKPIRTISASQAA